MPFASTHHPTAEKDLLIKLAASDEAAFAYVFREFYSALCTYAERITGRADEVDDLVNEVFEKLWQKHPSFNDIRHLKDFLYKATRNIALDSLKTKMHSLERQAIFAHSIDNSPDAATDLHLIRTEVYRTLYREIDRLPDQCRKIIRMGYLEGKKNEEIADLLGLSIQTVKNQKSRGITLLKTRIPPELLVLLLWMGPNG